MYCLLSTAEKTEKGFFWRLKRIAASDIGLTVRDTVVLGVRMLDVTIGIRPRIKPEEIRRMLRRAAESLRRERVREICFAKNFPYRAFFLREGFVEMNGALLTATLAGRVAARLGDSASSAPSDVPRKSGDGKYAVVLTAKLTVAALRTLSELCASFKYLMVMTETGGSREFESLRRRTGISVIEQPTHRQLMNADVAVVFGPLTQPVVLPAKCIAFGIGDGALKGIVWQQAVSDLVLGLANGTENELPDKFPRDVLLSAALGAGTLKSEDIIIEDVLLAGCTLYGEDS